MKLTTNELYILNCLARNSYTQANYSRPRNFNDVAGGIWTHSIEDADRTDFSRPKELKTNGIGGVVASLVQKGLVTTYDDKRTKRERGGSPSESTTSMTEKGYKVWLREFPETPSKKATGAKTMQQFEIINGNSVTPALKTRFEIHAAGCKDLDKYRNRKRTVIRTVSAADATRCVIAQVDRKSVKSVLADYGVMPCCGPLNPKVKPILPEPNKSNKTIVIKRKRKGKLTAAQKEARRQEKAQRRAERAKARLVRQKAREKKRAQRKAKRIARLTKRFHKVVASLQKLGAKIPSIKGVK